MILTIAGIRRITTQRPFVVRVFWIAAQQHTNGRIDKGIMIALILRKKEQHSIILSFIRRVHSTPGARRPEGGKRTATAA